MEILGIKIDAIKLSEAEAKIEGFLDDNSSKKHQICTVNTEFITRARKDPEFRKILNTESSLNLADGIGPIWAAKFLSLKSPSAPIVKQIAIFLQWIFSIALIPVLPSFFRWPIPQRISGVDFAHCIARISEIKKKEIFFLGGGPTITERAALQMQTEFIDLKIAGVDSSRSDLTDQIIESINRSKADILFVSFGAPKQEFWISQNLKKTSCKIAIGLGGTFDFLAGVKQRAPRWIQKTGLEWLFRLIIEPSRIIRQLSIPYFMFLVLSEKLTQTKKSDPNG